MLPLTIVLHYKKLHERKLNIINQLNNFKFDRYYFYEDYDQDELNVDIISEYYEPYEKNPNRWINKVKLWGPYAAFYHNKKLNLAQISLTIKFGKVFEFLIKQKFDYCIIFEDDIFLCENFDIKFNNYLNNTPKDWDIIYFNLLPSLQKNKTNVDTINKKTHPASRGGGSTLLKYNAVIDLHSTWFPFNLISDWELGYQHYYHNHNVYWWEPPLTIQGSKTGIFKSSLI